MTISRRLGIGYALITAISLGIVGWLAYHEFVEEPAEYAAMGLPDLHKDTEAEVAAIGFLAAIPAMLGAGWWWIRRVLKPLGTFAASVEKIHSHNLHEMLPRNGSGDEIDRLATVFNDMTHRLHQSFLSIQEFTLNASHELKTPLTVMRGQLESLQRTATPPSPEQSKWIDTQLVEIRRLTQIVDSLTFLTKADTGQVELDKQPIAFHEILRECFEDALILAHPAGVTVTLERCDACVLKGDRNRLRQLLLLLTDNAIKYNTPGGQLGFALECQGNMARLQVINTSAPVAQSTLDAAFERFARGENARGRVDGCGLGLSIARWIVRAHNGSIRLQALPPNRVCAQIELPCEMPTGTVPFEI